MAELSRGHLSGLRVAVTGATGNVGTALLRRLTAPDSGVAEIRGLARRQPPSVAPYDGVRWFSADLGDEAAESVLPRFLDGVDAVVHLAWALLPDRQPDVLERTNIEGNRRVMAAAGAAKVPHVEHMPPLGTYAAGPAHHPVGEDWPTTGIPSSTYSTQKARCEQELRRFSSRHPETTVALTRPTLVLQPDAASEIGRYFLGSILFPLARAVPGAVARMVPLPLPGSLRVAFVHADDVADAIARILDRRASGAFNLAADPTFDADGLARALGARRVPIPAALLRAGMQVAFEARLLQIEPGWLDMALGTPPLSSARARSVLGWRSTHDGGQLLREFVAALGRGEGGEGPLLHSGLDAGAPA